MRLDRLAAAIALVLLMACNGDRAAVSTEKSPAPAPVQKPAAGDVNPKFLSTWSEQLSSLGFAPNSAAFVDVEFGGPILHVTESGNRRRAVLVRDPSGEHTGLLVVRGADAAQFMAVFPKADFPYSECMGTTCQTTVDGVGLRITAVDDGPALSGFDQTHPSFAHVQHLKRYIAELHDDVAKDDPPTKGPVLAYMQLEGGRFTADTYQCDAKFGEYNGVPDPDDFRPFGATSTLRLVLRPASTPGANLYARTPKSSGWKKIRLSGTHLPILLANVSKYPDMSHFHLLAKLSKDPNQTLPNIIPKPGCIKMWGGVPGCGNNQWP